MDFQFDTNKEDAYSTIQKNLPDPNQGFQNSSIGSNVFNAIETFFSNTVASVCGARILILLKRYPNEADISQLVSLIRSHHAFVHVITSGTPSGGSQPKAMYTVASKTNGMGAFEYDEMFWKAIWSFPLSYVLYPVYATTIQVSGSETKSLPVFYRNSFASGEYKMAITYQDHVPIDSFQSLNLRWVNSGNSGNVTVNSKGSGANGTITVCYPYFNGFNYNMTLDYNYLGQDVQNLQIRIYNGSPPSNWLPYSD